MELVPLGFDRYLKELNVNDVKLIRLDRTLKEHRSDSFRKVKMVAKLRCLRHSAADHQHVGSAFCGSSVLLSSKLLAAVPV